MAGERRAEGSRARSQSAFRNRGGAAAGARARRYATPRRAASHAARRPRPGRVLARRGGGFGDPEPAVAVSARRTESVDAVSAAHRTELFHSRRDAEAADDRNYRLSGGQQMLVAPAARHELQPDRQPVFSERGRKRQRRMPGDVEREKIVIDEAGFHHLTVDWNG